MEKGDLTKVGERVVGRSRERGAMAGGVVRWLSEFMTEGAL